MKNDLNRFFSKCISSVLIAGCIFLSSPLILLADETAVPLPAETDVTPISAPLDIQPVMPADSSADTTTIIPVDSLNSSDPSASNNTTGSGSENISTTDVNNQTDIINQNFAEVFNDSFLSANTGQNNANYNTGSGIIATQKAEGRGELINVININSVNGQGNGVPSPDLATNTDTGADSTNSSQTNINNELTVKNVNEANVINRISAEIGSGSNDASFNTGHGMVATGDANLGLNFFSIANTNLFGSQFYANLQNIYNNFTGNIDLSNELANGSSPLSSALLNAANNSTGANSSNQAIVNVNDQTTIENQNTGKLNNAIDAKVVSGQNKTNYNTGSGSISSGDVNSSVNVINFLNSNITSGKGLIKTLNVFGDWTGDLTLPALPSPDLLATTSPSGNVAVNSSTGANSENSANSSTNNSVTIDNNNTAVIQNNVTIKTNSGSNGASYNGGSGIVNIGSASAETNEMNVANLNITGNSWYLVVVNKFGTWNGGAVGSPTSTVIQTNGTSTIFTPQNSGVNAANNSTGPESNSEAGANINHTLAIQIRRI